jgi:hypothetical protein
LSSVTLFWCLIISLPKGDVPIDLLDEVIEHRYVVGVGERGCGQAEGFDGVGHNNAYNS